MSPQKDRNKGFFHLDKAVNHSDLTEPKPSKKIGRPISYKRTQAKASVSNELQGMSRHIQIQIHTHPLPLMAEMLFPYGHHRWTNFSLSLA